MSKVVIRKIATIVSAIGCLLLSAFLFTSCNTGNESQLVLDFRSHLVDGDFKAMYEHSSNFMKGNVTETEFVARMATVAETLRRYDPNLEFRRNTEEENRIRQIRRDSETEHNDTSTGYTFALLDLGSASELATVHISWIRDGGRQKLFDLSVGEDHSSNNLINTVAGEPFMAPK